VRAPSVGTARAVAAPPGAPAPAPDRGRPGGPAVLHAAAAARDSGALSGGRKK